VVLDQPDEIEALRDHAPPRHVISHGQLLNPEAVAALAAG